MNLNFINETYTVFSASYYDFIDEVTKKPIQGGKITYMSKAENKDNQVGILIETKNISLELFKKLQGITKFPALVEITFSVPSLIKPVVIEDLNVVKND